ncbi:MAG: uroporphyrinogen decarboxylase family protein [Pirellulales bacterium]|nr:uroporphyrinogen decarboxylase family protein [Pirellulales bacterium]
MMNGKERILAMLTGGSIDCLPQMPITMMFAGDQAGIPYGRYATDYRCLVEAQLDTAEKFDFDYVSCISDPTREAADCGAAIQFFENQPPAVDENRARLREKSALASLRIPDPIGGGRMHDRVRAAALFKERVADDKLIEGWIEGPCAEAADLRGINTLMMDFFDDPAFVRDLFEFAVEMGVRFAQAQVEAGVDIIGVGDAAASLVGPKIYQEFVLPYEHKLIQALHAMGTRVRLHICGNTSRILDGLASLQCDIVDIDHMVPLSQVREAVGPDQVIAGNIDPVGVVRNGTPSSVAKGLATCHQQAGAKYIVAAGCEIPRDTPEANVMAIRDYARGHQPSCLPI